MAEQQSADEVLEALRKSGVIVCPSRCWSCMLRSCPGGWHSWADDSEDWERTVYLLGPDPRLQKCGCPCADGPELESGPDEPDWESLNAVPCPVCGSDGECAADSEGRPLIHAITDEDDA